MDFRSVAPQSVGWKTWYRGQPTARLADGKTKVVVQTPLCACRVSLAGAGMYRLTLTLHDHVPAHRAFCTWISDVEDTVTDEPGLAEWREGKAKSTTVYNGTMRLMMFGDTPAFDDATGIMSAEYVDGAAAGAAVLELTGCWSTDAKWGLRWKIVQFKFTKDPPTFPPVPMLDDDDDLDPSPSEPYLFVNE